MNRVALLVTLVLCCGCFTQLDAAVATSNAAAATLTTRHAEMRAAYTAEQEAAARAVPGDKTDPAVKAVKREAVKAVRAEWVQAWDAYVAARAAWVVLAAALAVARQAEDAGGLPDMASVLGLVRAMAQAQQQLLIATGKVSGAPPLP